MSKSHKPRIDELSQELNSLKETLAVSDLEVRRLFEKRNGLWQKTKELRVKAKMLKEKRDSVNKEVRRLKNSREQAKAESNEIQLIMLKLDEKRLVIADRKPIRNMNLLQKEINEIDWKIQTNSLTLDEEKIMVDQVKYLEGQLSVYKQLRKLEEKISELKERKRSLKIKAKIDHARLSELAEQSQSFHEEMIEILKEVQVIQGKANDVHQEREKKTNQYRALYKKYNELLVELNSLKKTLQTAEKEKKTTMLIGLKKNLLERAIKKLEVGQKLTWEEFQVLAEANKI